MIVEGQQINVGEEAQIRELDLSDRDVFIEAVYRSAKEHFLAESELAKNLSVINLDFKSDESPNKEGILVSGSGGSSMLIWGAIRDPHTPNGLPFVKFGTSRGGKLDEISAGWGGKMVVRCSMDGEIYGGQGVGEWDPERLRSPEGLVACVDMIRRACELVISLGRA